MAPLKLYMIQTSPPVRAVLMCAKAINVQLDHIHVDIYHFEHLKSDFIKMNPQHTVPTLDDNGFILWDSHAIMPYLIAKYGDNDFLYPKEPKKRAVVDQRMHFDSSSFWPHTINLFRPIMLENKKDAPQKLIDDLLNDYKLIEIFLSQSKFVAGDEVTIADFSLVTTITATDTLVPIDRSQFPRIMEWIKEMQKLPYYDQNQKGLDIFKEMFESKMNRKD